MTPTVVILSAFATPFRSGAEACAEEVARELSDKYDITVVTARLKRSLPKYDSLEGGVRLIRVGLGSKIDQWLFPFLAPFAARRLKPDLIHAVLESYAGLALVLCALLVPRAKRLLTLQSTNTKFLLRAIHLYPDAITAISSYLVARAERYGRHNVMLIPNGVRLDQIMAAASMPKATPARILFVGRLEPMKGVDTLLRAYALLPAERRETTVLRIVGHGSLRKNLEKQAADLGISKHVTFTGYIPSSDVASEFAQAHVFCGLSRSEALGNVFLEAQAAGCAVIASSTGGITDIVKNEQTGLLVPVDNPRAAAEAMERVLSEEALRTTLSVQGKKHAERYDWNAIAGRYEAVYKDLLEHSLV